MIKKLKKGKAISLLAGTVALATLTTAAYSTSNGYNSLYNLYDEEIVSEINEENIERNKLGISNASYNPYNSNLVDDSITIPIVNSMVPQGVCVASDCCLVSSYDYQKQENSTVSVLDFDGSVVNVSTLDSSAHVGGLSYDTKNDLLWISDSNGTVAAYKLDDLKTKEASSPIYSGLDVGQGLPCYSNPDINAVSYLSVYDDTLFVGSYSTKGAGLVKQYTIDIDDDKIVHLKLQNSFMVPSRVQGITFYEKDGSKYMLLSRSGGRNNSSVLQIFRYDPSVKDYSTDNINSISYMAPSMMEQISESNGKLYSIFESAARPYSETAKDVVDSVYVSDIDSIIQPLDSVKKL